MNTKNFKRVNPFNYFGGKTRYLDFILPLIPHGTYTHYYEDFCGSASVFFNKKKDPIETINDIDGRLINFFKVLRTEPERLVEQLLLTPYSRSEFQQALGEDTDPVEQARRYFVRTMMAFGSAGSTKRRVNSFRIGFTESRNGRAMASHLKPAMPTTSNF